jgi:predicted RNA-binding protein associated with RNAse of E/G family
MKEPITVIKRNLAGEETWRYTGQVLERGPDFVRLEARFNRPDLPFMGIILKQGDPFLETYYTNRWYNIFEIHDRDDGRIKGWYCNVARPAVLEADDRLSFVDLALDLWVAADGTAAVLDEEEFADLNLDPETTARAWAALDALLEIFNHKNPLSI